MRWRHRSLLLWRYCDVIDSDNVIVVTSLDCFTAHGAPCGISLLCAKLIYNLLENIWIYLGYCIFMWFSAISETETVHVVYLKQLKDLTYATSSYVGVGYQHNSQRSRARFQKRSARDRLRYDPVILIGRSHSTNADHDRLIRSRKYETKQFIANWIMT